VRLELRSATAEDTRAIGEALAGLLEAGDTVILTGELGAGKTTLVQGIARGLGVEDRISSPTFVLVHEHEGRLPITHADVYRLERVQEVLDLELVDEGRVLLVEWGDAVRELLPATHLRIELSSADEHDLRRIAIDPVGRSWLERSSRLAAALGPWKATA
jgi:tRNA threonylcarbamoyladenosine biosynthesis protein TsaE